MSEIRPTAGLNTNSIEAFSDGVYIGKLSPGKLRQA
jgi:hypothetical protein